MLKRARERSVTIPTPITTPYVNTIGVHEEPYFPGDEAAERKYRGWIRWNAAVMVTRAQRPGVAVGGHISSYASIATLYRSEEHTSELQSRENLVCRLLLEKK